MARSIKLYLVIPALLVAAASGFAFGYFFAAAKPQTADVNSNQTASVVASSPVQTPTPEQTPATTAETPTPQQTPEESLPKPEFTPAKTEVSPAIPLMIPVVGIKPDELRDTFTEARSEGRTHEAIDIVAPKGTPVIAAADGTIARFFESQRGGITIYQYSADKKLIYYYAHLERRAENLREGDFVGQGTTIGYVGDTGNAGAGNYHLHFAIWKIEDPKRFWEGANLNPYPLLKNGKIQ